MRLLKFTLISLLAILVWSVFAVAVAFYGWWMHPVVAQGDAVAFHSWAKNEITNENRGNTALLLIEDGLVVGEHFSEGVDRDTLFPTASFSKWVAALAVMKLVQTDQIDLDAPAGQYLTRWQLPDSGFDNRQVTIRRLLSHTAGLTDRLGFGDYTRDEMLPAIEDELRKPRASGESSPSITVGVTPGSEFIYSGGSYLILELVVEEVTGQPFEQYVQEAIFTPLAMSRSTYAYLGDLEKASLSFNPDGSVAPSYQYASAAATGLSSSAADLLSLVEALLEHDNTPLDQPTVAAMREPHGYTFGAAIWGLGTILFVQAPGGDYVFGHDGANAPAINASVRINPETSDGFIMLVSGHPTLASNIGSEWVLWQTGYPDFLLTERALGSALLPILLGTFAILAIVFWTSRRK